MEPHEGQREVGPRNSPGSRLQEHRSLGTNTSSRSASHIIYLVPRADRMLEIIFVRAFRARDAISFIPGGVDWQRERDCVRPVLARIARVGNTITSLVLVETLVWTFAPRTTIPSGRSSTIRT